MANKFQKSVLERLEAEEQRRKQEAKAAPKELTSPLPAQSPPEPVPEHPVKENEQKDQPEPLLQPVSQTPSRILADVSAYLSHEPQRVAKNKTFYLDYDVINAIKQAAREQRVTDSRLVNDILRRVLGLS